MKLYYRLGAAFVLALVILLFVSIASAQPPVPHPLEGRDDCLACHQTGVGGAPRMAPDHVGRANETCGQCHVPIGVEPAAVLAIPHPVEGREACLACHEAGLGGASKIPDDHVGRADETCGQCHVAAAAAPGAVSPISPALPLIPHPVEGREACLTCHEAGLGGASKIPADHAGRTDETCRQCHIAAGVTPTPVPPISHPVEGREACLACHAGWMGQAPLVPDDHAERLNEACQLCHQPPMLILATPTAPPLPTPIVHPVAPGKNSCLECHRTLGEKHADITHQWEGSYFATLGVTCADCHGGDPGADDITAAKSPETGYIGVPDRTAIPSLCGSCHADPERMRPYELPVDQLREYEESVHGQLLAQGDENAPTCFDCHGSHATQVTNDPRSSVYPTNLPATCAHCHADEERMEPYGIPTDQYELYQKSVHGVALLEEQNLEAPSCPTCHSSHGATLAGYAEVIDVCGQCHSLSEKYYLTGGHRRGRQEGSEAPRCITCHGRYDVEPASLDLFVGDEPRDCGSCHASGSLERVAIDALYQTLVGAEQALEAAEEALDEARTSGLSLDAQEARLEEARTRLAEAAAAQHELQLETIEEKATEVESISAEIQEAVETNMTRRGMESWLLPGIIAAALGLGGLIVNLVWRRAETR
jgi:hypothetical protein